MESKTATVHATIDTPLIHHVMRTKLLIASSFFLLSASTHTSTIMQQKPIMPYKISGEGSPLVLVPGGVTGWVSWDAFVPHFSKNRKVIQVQLLNVQYGLDDKPLPENYEVRTESLALEAALSSAGLNEKADFIGWSYGAFIALDYALRHPEKIRTLTLIEPPALWIIKEELEKDPQLRKVKDYLSSAPGANANVTEEDLEAFLTFAGLSKPGESVRSLPQWDNWVNFRRSLRNVGVVLVHDDDTKRLRDISAPVLLVKGTGSAYFLHRIIDRCSEMIRASRVVEFPGGHAPHLVSRDEFLEALESFQR